MPKQYLVTGGAGFIGSRVAAALAARGDRVRVLDSLVTGQRTRLEGGENTVEFREGDIRSQADVLDALAAVTCVIHLAGLRSVPRSRDQPELIRDVNVNGTRNLLKCAQTAGVTRVIYASSVLVYGGARYPQQEDQPLFPVSPYGLSKAEAEQLCLDPSLTDRIETVILRYFNVYGPGQDAASKYAAVIPEFIKRLSADQPCVIFGDGGQSRDFIYIADAVRATLAACDIPGLSRQTINVGSGNETSIRKIADILREILGKAVNPVYREHRPGDVSRSLADTRRCQNRLRLPPCLRITEGLKKTVAWFQGQGRNV